MITVRAGDKKVHNVSICGNWCDYLEHGDVRAITDRVEKRSLRSLRRIAARSDAP